MVWDDPPAGRDVQPPHPVDGPFVEGRTDGAHECLRGPERVEQRPLDRRPKRERRCLVVLPRDGEHRPTELRGCRAAGSADRLAGGDELTEEGRSGVEHRQGLEPGRSAGHVEQAGPTDQRELADLVPTERVHRPLRHREEPHGASGLGFVPVQPEQLRQAGHGVDGAPGGAPVGLLAEAGPYFVAVTARVVPCQRRPQRDAVAVQEYAGLGHAGDADGQRLRARLAACAGGRRGGRTGERRRLDVGVGPVVAPRGRHGVLAEQPEVEVGRDRLDPGGADVDADQGAGHRAPAASSGLGARHTTTSAPRTCQRPADHGTTNAAPRPTSSVAPPSVLTWPAPARTRQTANPATTAPLPGSS